MKNLILILIILLMSCENDSTTNVKKEKLVVSESSSFVNIFDLNNPAVGELSSFAGNRLYVSVVENDHELNNAHLRARVDVKHYIGRPDFFIDYGQVVKLNDVKLARERIKIDDSIDYNFDYDYDSKIHVSDFPEALDFNSLTYFSNVNENGQGSSKRIQDFNERLYVDKRINFENIEFGQSIDANTELEIELNRHIGSTSSAFGFVYYDNSDNPVYMTLNVSARTAKINIPSELLKQFKDKVGLDQFECYIWIAETKQIEGSISTTMRSTLRQNQTPVLINQVLSKRVVF